MSVWPGAAASQKFAACSSISGSFSRFTGAPGLRNKACTDFGPQLTAGTLHPSSPQQSQTEAFHGFKRSNRSSTHRRLKWVTESHSIKKKKKHSDLLSQQKFSAVSPAGRRPSRESKGSLTCAPGWAALPTVKGSPRYSRGGAPALSQFRASSPSFARRSAVSVAPSLRLVERFLQ